ncbi:14928_t:CDS:1, partial [Dentiscutata heterogama]
HNQETLSKQVSTPQTIVEGEQLQFQEEYYSNDNDEMDTKSNN